MEHSKLPHRYWIRAVIVFIIAFILINSGLHLQILHHKTEEQLKASYTAEATVRRIESQLNRYLEKSSFLKRIIESGHTMDDAEFMDVASLMMDKNDALQCIELAKDGIITQLYPPDQSEVLGHTMFDDTERGECARKARDSGEYTIAGPFELIQGSMGALLFDPIYTEQAGEKTFWGFSLLVIDWNKFVEELQLNKLEEAAYQFRIWKFDSESGEQVTIAQGQEPAGEDALEVVCKVPNDEWHFDIMPEGGWYSGTQMAVDALFSMLLALLVTVVYWQFEVRRYKDKAHAEEIKRSADAERAANAAKTGFLARMSHDIRTPLNGIIGLLKINETHADDQELIKANRRKMMVAANHLLALISDVLQMSKLESGEMVLAHEVVNLNRLSEDILSIVGQRAADGGVSMEYDMDAGKVVYPFVYGSPLHLRQLFLNIYSNAIKYNHVGGRVETRFSFMGVKNGIVTYRWEIKDTGVGMSKAFLEHIFEPFAQERINARSVYNGTGLGMSIVKTLIDKMNGTIEVQSEEGHGSTFTITLPFEIAEAGSTAQDEPAARGSIRGLRLMLAEDNELNAEIAEMLLRDEGAEVNVVRDGAQAIREFATSPVGWYDAILMDIMMPEVDGLSATRVIRAMDRPDAQCIPIIAMTANAYDEDAQQCLAAGMNAHLAKPIQMDRVVQTISQFCSKA